MMQDTVHVRYMVDDVDAAVRFYTTHLGFSPLTNMGPAFADVQRGNLRLQVLALVNHEIPHHAFSTPLPCGGSHLVTGTDQGGGDLFVTSSAIVAAVGLVVRTDG